MSSYVKQNSFQQRLTPPLVFFSEAYFCACFSIYILHTYCEIIKKEEQKKSITCFHNVSWYVSTWSLKEISMAKKPIFSKEKPIQGSIIDSRSSQIQYKFFVSRTSLFCQPFSLFYRRAHAIFNQSLRLTSDVQICYVYYYLNWPIQQYERFEQSARQNSI